MAPPQPHQPSRQNETPGPAAPMYIVVKVKKFLIGFVLLLTIVAISVISKSTTTQEEYSAMSSSGSSSSGKSSSKRQHRSEFNAKLSMSMSTSMVQIHQPYGSGSDHQTLEFYHCGTRGGNENTDTENVQEVVLLHGAKFTKEDWVTSGILEQFCLKGSENEGEQQRMSFLALDLSVRADGDGFRDTIESLVKSGMLSGRPVAVVSPSASGKCIVDLGRTAHAKGQQKVHQLRDIVSHWIPVASPAVLQVKDDGDLSIFESAGVHVLAIHGDKDEMGKRVTKKLTGYGAKGVEIKGGHPCYLESQNEFVDTVLNFIKGVKDDS